MKNLLQRLITYLWVVKHITVAYWKYKKEMRKDPYFIKEYPLVEIPTFALEYYLKMMDGQEMDDDKLRFTNQCKREYEFRERILLVDHGV